MDMWRKRGLDCVDNIERIFFFQIQSAAYTRSILPSIEEANDDGVVEAGSLRYCP